MRVNLVHENKLIHATIEDEECPYYFLEIIEDEENGQVIIKANNEMINSLYVEDLDKLSISDFMFNKCLYTLYKKFMKVMKKVVP